MNTSGKLKAQRAAHRHQEFLERLHTERAARAEAGQRERENRESKLAELREQKRVERDAEAARAQREDQARFVRLRDQRAARRQESQPHQIVRAGVTEGQRRQRAEVMRSEERMVVSRAHPAVRELYKILQQRRPAPPAGRLAREQQSPTRLSEQQRQQTLRPAITRQLRGQRAEAEGAKPRVIVSRAHPAVRELYRIAKAAALQQRRPAPPAARVVREAQSPMREPQRQQALRPTIARQQRGQRVEAKGAEQRVAVSRAHPAVRELYRLAKPAVLQQRRPAPPAGRLVREQQSPARLREQVGQQTLRPAIARQQRGQRAEIKGVEQRGAPSRTHLAVRRLYRIAKPAILQRRRAVPLMASTTSAQESPSPELPENLLWLRTHDGYIVDENGKATNLRGINITGLDAVAPVPDQTVAQALSVDDANLSIITELWGANLVRVPFQAQTILAGNKSLSGGDLLSGLDDLITVVANAGAYVLLAQQTLVGTGGDALPDADVFECWRTLATRYVDEPAVLFEIFASTSPLASNWLHIALVLVGTIRKEHPASLLFLGNGSAGWDVTGLPLRFTTGDPVPNIVYTIRVDPKRIPVDENAELSRLTDSFPVVASQWSDGGSEFDRSSELAANLFERYGIGWVACSWNAEPRLVTNSSAHDFSPTTWGLTVQRALTLPVKPQYEAFLPDC